MRRLSRTFPDRVDRASIAIRRGRTQSRSFDDCFEQGDGDAVVTALVRRAAKNPELHRGICRLHGGEFPAGWLATAETHREVRNLTDLSRRLLDRYAETTGQSPDLWVVYGPMQPRVFCDKASAESYAEEVRRHGHKIPDPRGYSMPDGPRSLVAWFSEVMA